MTLPLAYDESRARFRHAAWQAGLPVEEHPIAATGPFGQRLTIDVVAAGDPRPARALVVLSGVHGVEGFACSAIQTALLSRLPASLPPGAGVLLVHAVNPWGMAWWRRQNEHNVDLNRNFRRGRGEPQHNDAYDEVHALACPDADDVPAIETMLAAAQRLVDERGLAWVRDAITVGQYRHPDGLHFGGDRTEESSAIVERIVTERLTGAERVLTIDLHTGHGPRGAFTALSDQPPGSEQDVLLRSIADRVEATADNPDATTGLKSGQMANGFRDVLPGTTCFATSLEIGTVDDLTQLGATYQEQWVHRRGDVSVPAHRAVRWAYRCCFTPDDPAWEDVALRDGARHVDAALGLVLDWA